MADPTARTVSAGLVLLSALLLAGCGSKSDSATTPATSTLSPPVEAYVSGGDLGDEWPLTVPGGTLRCEGPGAVSFQADEGIIYAVNATGKAWSRTNNLAWRDVELIQAPDPNSSGQSRSLSTLIARGVALCTTQ